MLAYWKLLLIARSSWKRIPPAQRRALLLQAQKQARKHGPAVARGVTTAVRTARKAK